jgi:putative membrane protein
VSSYGLVLLALGIAVLAALWLGPLPGASRRAFSMHMILHLGVAIVAAPLIALGLAGSLRADEGGAAAHSLALAVAATLFEMLVVWGWHVPSMHEAAAAHDGVFVLQQLSFLVAGLAIWWFGFSRRSRAAAAIAALAMMFTFVHMAMLGVLIALAPHLLYAPQFCLGAFGLDPVDDQRLGGALMASFGGLPYLLGALALLAPILRD